ncbi:DNA (Cytosine-5)-methyltransferase DRM1/2 isoform 4 [Hibiscus syriacus]|uniref:DNA (Cytosine-5)-methyltransferase DRM1/2 isoform 4 n=1 Tax=Hibiscus syriacus TaxID=106335 RepID=A0A6A3BD36_HIBSY|nr:DNA (Cytosine-5)-methyltransferase DRM1/2 isoform 4 [Hibiscus syriacus]
MQHVDSDNYSSDYEAILQDDFTDIDSSSDTEEILNSNSNEENKLLYLTKMGYSEAEASIAMERCGLDSLIAELTDFICASQMAKAADKQRELENKLLNKDDHAVHLSNLMIGFGVPTKPDQITQRTLPEDVIGPPYFYYENVELAPVGIWTKMSRNKVVPLEHDEVEMLLDFPKNHTQGGGSVRDMFHDSINILSLFSGINDEEVVLYCLGIPLKANVQELNDDWLEQLMSRFGEFDLVVGGIQLTASSAVSRYTPHVPLFPNHGEAYKCRICSDVKFKFNNLLKDIMDIILTRKMIDMEEVTMMYQDLSQYHGITRVQVVTYSFP